MAEQSKSEIHERIKMLSEECVKLEDLVDQLGQDAIEMKKVDEEERQVLLEEHQAMHKEKA